MAASLATVGGVAYLGVGFAHLHEALGDRATETATLAPAPVPAAPAVVAASPAPDPDSAALDEMRNELAAVRQQLTTVSQNYAQANTNYQQAGDKLLALAAQNNQLQAQLADAAARVKSAQEERDAADRRTKTAEQALNASKSSNAMQLAKTLDTGKHQLQQSEVERTTLQNRVQQLEMDLQATQIRANQLDAKNQQLQQQQLAADPQRIPSAAVGNAPAARPAMVPPEAIPPERKPLSAGPHAQNRTSGASSELERLLASTGLDVDRLLHGLDSAPGEGGPYIALNDPRAAPLDRQRLEDLKRLAKMLPLAAPLNQYRIGSGFGPRIDPLNHRASFHPGLDLDAPYRTTVYSTGAGMVIFTGTMDGYGRVVEIDHGHGIVTRYAHLHRILVAKGQRVAVHTPIGELGSTGRSTGPHLHYEVRVDGTAVDPAKFMRAGKNVVQINDRQ
ncbi:MAG TPA: peptidoglycan DD-metalloendopeptidase family protein [Stellaceae bacterium]|nr:peptidoglycan DD-metalloendopeptidase family protein [Stellaceae bacterium]